MINLRRPELCRSIVSLKSPPNVVIVCFEFLDEGYHVVDERRSVC
jgi:hypothetical protein